MKINAFAATKPGSATERFTYEQKLGRHDVLISITHCTIAMGDVQMMNNAWNDSHYPLVAGHEIIGVIEKAGATVKNLKAGDRVGVGYQLEACFRCVYCKSGHEQFCAKQRVIGVHRYGGLAEQIVVDHRFAFRISRKLPSSTTAPLLSSGVTVFAAIMRGGLSRNSRTAVLGIGGLGHLAIQFLEKMGHKVSAFSRSDNKRALAESLGATLVDTSKPEAFASMKGQFDFILSTLNVDYDINAYLQMLKPQGKFCMVAQPPNTLSLNGGLLYEYAQRTIYGNYTGSRTDMKAMLAFAAKHDIKSIVEVMPFSEINSAIDRVSKGRVPMRLVLERSR